MSHRAVSRRGYYTTGEMARRLACAQFTVIRRIDSGRMPGYRLPGRASHRRCSKAAFDRHVKQRAAERSDG